MSIIRKVFIILLGVTLMFMNISGVKAQDDNTTTDFSNYITAASLDYKEGDKEIAYKTDTKLTEDTPLVFKLDADVPSSALSSDHKIDYQLPDNLNVDDTTSDHIYLKDDLTKSVGNYTIADHHMVIDLSALDYGVDSSKSIELDLETTTSHLIFTDSEAKIYFRKATNESPTEVMVSVLQNYANDTKADPNSIIKNTNTDTNTKKSSKQVITMSGVKRANNPRKAIAGVTQDGFTEIYGNINDLAKDGGLSGKYRLTDKPDGTTADTTLDKDMSGANAGVLIKNKKDVTIDLNGHKLQLYDGLYFDIQSGGHLTILDSASKNYSPQTPPKEDTSNDGENTSNAGKLCCLSKDAQDDPDGRAVPMKLDYYVTHAEANGTKTTDTTTKYEVDLSHAGRIYSETGSTGGQDSTFMIEKGGTLDFESGVAYNKDIKDKNNNENTGDNHVVATKGDSGSGTATLNLSGGYLIGNRGDNAARNTTGNVIYNNAGNTLNISGGVITNGQAENGGGIYNAGGTINLSGGIITGNEAVNDGNDSTSNRYSGGGIYMKSGILNISGDAYITNNKKKDGASNANHFSVHGGGGVAADNDSQVNMSGGYITGNYSNEAGGGLYLGYFSQSGLTKLTLTGGIIASNVAQTGEGGGLRVGGSGRATIRATSRSHPIYITNNTTNTGSNETSDENGNKTGDWGGGGVFVQQNGQMTVMNAIITENTADGFGAGVSACPTGKTDIVTDQGAAIYSNHAKGEHYSRGSGTENEKKNEDAVAYDFYHYHENNCTDYQDYFLAHAGNSQDPYTITNAMLGGGSEKYSGTFNGNESYEQHYNSRYQSAKFIGLSADPSQEDIDKALVAASTYISGNHSHNHGGGIMTNGMLNIGESTEVYPALHLKAYKAFLLNASDGKSSKSLSMKNNQFKFAIYQHTGDSSQKPQWDGTKFTGGSGVNTLVSEFGNEDADENHLSQLSESIPNYLFEKAGDYTFYLVEEDNEYSYINYDHTIYRIQFKVVISSTKTENNVETTTYSIDQGTVNISKITSGEEKGLSSSDYSYAKDASKNTSQLTLHPDQKAAFTNTQQAYDLAITKIEKDKTDRKLQGAAFTLYKIADNYKEVISPNVTAIETKTTNQDGLATFSMLKGGKVYYLKETKAPDQHKIAGPWIISIDLNGNAKFYDADCKESDNFDLPNAGDYITLTKNSSTLWKDHVTDLTKENNKESNVFSVIISDEAIQYTMPNTGGIGTYIYYQVGILLITLVNIVWIIKRRVV